MATSLLLYLALFGYVVDRPLSAGGAFAMIDAKASALDGSGDGPRLVVVAGSNGRYSHSCAVMARHLGMPCINFGVAANIGLDYLLDRVEQELHPGDVVYMPLEYFQYAWTRTDILTSFDTGPRFRNDRGSLRSRGPEGTRVAFAFDLPYLVRGAAEQALAAAGQRRRTGAHTMNAHGDETGHDATAAAGYREAIAATAFVAPDVASVFPEAARDGGQRVVRDFLRSAEATGISVIGGLPTIFDDAPVPEDIVARLGAFYAGEGADFLVLDNRSQYPRVAFYDSGWHLTEEWQGAHSARLAAALASQLGRPSGPEAMAVGTDQHPGGLGPVDGTPVASRQDAAPGRAARAER